MLDRSLTQNPPTDPTNQPPTHGHAGIGIITLHCIESAGVNVPLIQLVVGGGLDSMKTVVRAVTKGIPVLVVQGSGHAADFIAYGYHLSGNPNR